MLEIDSEPKLLKSVPEKQTQIQIQPEEPKQEANEGIEVEFICDWKREEEVKIVEKD